MELTVEVMLPPRGAQDFSLSAHPKYRVLAPISVYARRSENVRVYMPNTGFLHVTNVPARATWTDITKARKGLCAALCVPHERVIFGGVLPIYEWLGPRAWHGNSEALPPPVRKQLLEDRQAVIPWGLFKALMVHTEHGRNLADEDLAD